MRGQFSTKSRKFATLIPLSIGPATKILCYLQIRRPDKSLIHTDGAQSEILVVVSGDGVVG